jgi:hypothetical protein
LVDAPVSGFRFSVCPQSSLGGICIRKTAALLFFAVNRKTGN